MLQFCLEEHLQMCTGQCFFSLWSNLQNFSALSFDDRPVGICLWVSYLSPNALGNKSPRGSSQDYLPDYCLKQFGLFFWRLGFLSDPSPMFALPCHSVKNEVEFTQPLQKSRNLSWMMLNLIVGFVKIVTSISRPLPNKNKPMTLNKVELNCCFLSKLLHGFGSYSIGLKHSIKFEDSMPRARCALGNVSMKYARKYSWYQWKTARWTSSPSLQDDNIDPTSWQKTGKSRKFEKNLVVDWASAARRSRSRLKST